MNDIEIINIYLIETPFNTIANRADKEQEALLLRVAWSGSTLFAYGNMIRCDPPLVDLTCNLFFYVQTWKFIYITIHSGWN